MGKSKRSIFERQADLRPSQINAVAEQRYRDAKYLMAGPNSRLNAAMYLAGFSVECLLKGRLLKKLDGYNQFGVVGPAAQKLRTLVFQSHNLSDMLVELPELELQLKKLDPTSGKGVYRKLVAVCSLWTIYARYSPVHANRTEAKEFVSDIGEIKSCLLKL